MGKIELASMVTAAGIQRRHSAEEFPMDEWDEVLSMNRLWPLSLAVRPYLRMRLSLKIPW